MPLSTQKLEIQSEEQYAEAMLYELYAVAMVLEPCLKNARGLDPAGDLILFILHILHQFLSIRAGDDPVPLWQGGRASSAMIGPIGHRDLRMAAQGEEPA